MLSEHLDPGYTADFEGIAPQSAASLAVDDEALAESSLLLQGGDIHRDLYRIQANTKRAKMHHRSATFSHATEYAPSESDYDAIPYHEQLAQEVFEGSFWRGKVDVSATLPRP